MMKRKQYLTMLLLTTPLMLSACDTQYMYETITGDRPDQVVDGPRRVPVLNANRGAAVPPSAAKPQPMVTTVENGGVPQVNMNPYDSYDAKGDVVETKVETNEGTMLSRWWDRTFPPDDVKPAPVKITDNVRKPLPGNPYVSPETSQAAPVQESPSMLGRLADRITGDSKPEDNKLTYPKLSSVPPTPKKIAEVKSRHPDQLGELETDHAVAQQDKGYLDREVKAPAPVTLTTAPAEPIKPLAPLPPEPKPAPALKAPAKKPKPVEKPAVSSLPAVTISASPAPAVAATPDNAPAPVALPAPIAPAPAPTPLQPADDNVTPYTAPLPSPDIIKTMKPSRYEHGQRQ